MGAVLKRNLSSIMKIFLAFLALVAIALAQNPPKEEPEGCEFCRAGVGIMFNHMAGDALDKVMLLLEDFVCPNYPLEEIELCQTNVKKYWPIISQILFNDEAAKYVCAGLSEGACEAFQYGQKELWSCDVCVQDVNLVGIAYSPEYGVPGMVEALQGPIFCENQEIWPEEQQEGCKMGIAGFMPPAMYVITNAWFELSREICRDWFDGICP